MSLLESKKKIINCHKNLASIKRLHTKKYNRVSNRIKKKSKREHFQIFDVLWKAKGTLLKYFKKNSNMKLLKCHCGAVEAVLTLQII